eukprot:g4852.t1
MSPLATAAWFEAEGVELKEESDGRVFPVTDNAETVAGALLSAAERAGVCTLLRANVQSVTSAGEGSGAHFVVECGGGGRRRALQQRSPAPFTQSMQCGALLLATGSAPAGHALARCLGHTVVPPLPSLFSFRAAAPLLEGLAGVALRDVELGVQAYGEVDGEGGGEGGSEGGGEGGGGRGRRGRRGRRGGGAHTQRGPLLITHRGVSGPAALRLSAFAAEELCACRYRGLLLLRLVPGLTLPDAARVLREHAVAHGSACVHAGAAGGGRGRKRGRRGVSTATHPSFGGAIPRRVWDALASRAATPPIPAGTRWADCTRAQLAGLATLLSAGVSLPFRGKDTNKEEFVTAGGVALDEVRSFRTMESALVPGLFFAGEMLDVDGVTGGFNFQACWTTGHHAGEAAARALLSRSRDE